MSSCIQTRPDTDIRTHQRHVTSKIANDRLINQDFVQEVTRAGRATSCQRLIQAKTFPVLLQDIVGRLRNPREFKARVWYVFNAPGRYVFNAPGRERPCLQRQHADGGEAHLHRLQIFGMRNRLPPCVAYLGGGSTFQSLPKVIVCMRLLA